LGIEVSGWFGSALGCVRGGVLGAAVRAVGPDMKSSKLREQLVQRQCPRRCRRVG